jgi:hypothetical protein
MTTNSERDSGLTSEKDLRLTNRALLPFLAAGVAIILLRYLRLPGLEPLAVALMWAASCLISGVIIGFIFCIPRVVEADRKQNGANQGGVAQPDASARPGPNTEAGGRLQVNSNLVEISDWLTKIIVGLGLVNLKDIPGLVAGGAQVLAAGLAQAPTCKADVPCVHYAFAVALIVAFSILGFLMGYLYTRLFLTGAFVRADAATTAQTLDEKADEEIEQNDEAPSLTTSDAELAAAARLKDVPEAQDRQAAVAALQKLADDYELVRATMDPSAERTRAMTRVLVKMRTLALTAWHELPRFIASASSGQRLAAIAMLQVKPDASHIGWLIERLTSERPFMGYAAAEALRRAASVFTSPPEKELLSSQLQRFAETAQGAEFLAARHDRANLLVEVMRSLNIAPTRPD